MITIGDIIIKLASHNPNTKINADVVKELYKILNEIKTTYVFTIYNFHEYIPDWKKINYISFDFKQPNVNEICIDITTITSKWRLKEKKWYDLSGTEREEYQDTKTYHFGPFPNNIDDGNTKEKYYANYFHPDLLKQFAAHNITTIL